MDKPQNPIDKLVARFSRAANFEVKPVRGVVEQVDTLEEGGKKVYVLHVANGKQRESFWLAHNYADPYFYAPRQGDQVKGTVNTFDDNLEFAGETHKPVFDFENLSNDSERAAFAWFKAQAANQSTPAAQPLSEASRDTLYRKLGLRLNGPP